MIRKLLNMLGYNVIYAHEWGVWSNRYSWSDMAMARPIHRNMSVAPPDAKRIFIRLK